MSKTPEKRPLIPPDSFEDFKEATFKQIEKDFGLQGITITLSRECLTYLDILKSLAKQLEELELLTHPNFHSLLYQLDISESFVFERISPKKGPEAIIHLADSIIKRCFAKVWYRQRFK